MTERTKDVLRRELSPIKDALEKLCIYMENEASDGYDQSEFNLSLALELVQRAHPDK